MTSNNPSEPKFGEGSPLPVPARVLYKEPLDYTWGEPKLIPIENLGNNCFMNSVIQCLQYVPIWTNYLSKSFVDECPCQKPLCFHCYLGMITREANKIKCYIDPHTLCNKLTEISKDFLPHRQEDAHEFLVCFLERMQEKLAIKPTDPYIEMTTAVGQIFGGFLRSQISCQECLATSNTYEPYFNISLDIQRIFSIETALNKFFEIDTLDNCQWYNCEKCEKQTRAAKRYTIETLPEVLIIHLKRFNNLGEKLDHCVEFPRILDLQSHMSSNENYKRYRLYGLITHWGFSLMNGHYETFISHPACDKFNWHCIDDEKIFNMEWCDIENAEAYLLFYIKCDPHIEVDDIEDISKPIQFLESDESSDEIEDHELCESYNEMNDFDLCDIYAAIEESVSKKSDPETEVEIEEQCKNLTISSDSDS